MAEWMYRSTIFTSALDGGEWSASSPGSFTPAEGVPGTRWIGGWVDRRAGLDDVENCVENRPCELIVAQLVRRFSVFFWNPKFRYYFHNGTPLDPNMSQSNPVHILPPYSFKMYFDCISPSMLMSSKWSLKTAGFLQTFFVAFLISPMHASTKIISPGHVWESG
jgi:hypothetical protein